MSIILIGRNDADALGAGWHPVQEGPAGVPCRWMSPRAEVRLRMGGLAGLAVTVSVPGMIQGLKPGLSVYDGPRRLGHCNNLGPEGAWSVVDLPFDGRLQRADHDGAELLLTLVVEMLDGTCCVPMAFVPHTVMGNGDLRELGTLVSSIRLVTAQ